MEGVGQPGELRSAQLLPGGRVPLHPALLGHCHGPARERTSCSRRRPVFVDGGRSRLPSGFLAWMNERAVNRVRRGMGIGVSIFLIAVGLILALAVDVALSGIDVQTIGWILTLVGIGGLVLTLALSSRRGRRIGVREEAVIHEAPVVRETPVIREERVVRDDPPRY